MLFYVYVKTLCREVSKKAYATGSSVKQSRVHTLQLFIPLMANFVCVTVFLCVRLISRAWLVTRFRFMLVDVEESKCVIANLKLQKRAHKFFTTGRNSCSWAALLLALNKKIWHRTTKVETNPHLSWLSFVFCHCTAADLCVR